MVSKAVIWDMDGVIADTAPFHFEAWQQIARIEGVSFTKSDFRQIFGKRNAEIIVEIFGQSISAREMESLAQSKEEMFRRIAGQSVKPFPGVLNLLHSMHKAEWKMALASSTPVENIELITGTLEITELFDAIVSADDVSQGKPNPEVFLTAAEKLAIDPARCIVIEDSIAGIQAARAAGMKCIALTTTNRPSRLSEADLIVDRMDKVTVRTLDSLLP